MTLASDLDYVGGRNVRGEERKWGYVLHGRFGADALTLLADAVRKIFAYSLHFSAGALWLWPGSNWAADLIAMKVAVAVALVIMAMILLLKRAEKAPEVHVDVVRKEVRVIERNGRKKTLQRYFRFSDLADIYVQDHALHLIDTKGAPLAVIALDPTEDPNQVLSAFA